MVAFSEAKWYLDTPSEIADLSHITCLPKRGNSTSKPHFRKLLCVPGISDKIERFVGICGEIVQLLVDGVLFEVSNPTFPK